MSEQVILMYLQTFIIYKLIRIFTKQQRLTAPSNFQIICSRHYYVSERAKISEKCGMLTLKMLRATSSIGAKTFNTIRDFRFVDFGVLCALASVKFTRTLNWINITSLLLLGVPCQATKATRQYSYCISMHATTDGRDTQSGRLQNCTSILRLMPKPRLS